MSWKKIISIEFPKLLRPGNYILLGILLLIYFGRLIFTIYMVNENESDNSVYMLVTQFSSLETGVFGLFVALLIILNTGREFSEGTLKKNIIDGFSRDQFFIGKLLLLLIFTIATVILGKIILLIIGISMGNLESIISELNLPLLINPFINILHTGIFAFFLIFLTRNTIISIITYFVWGAIESIVMFIPLILDKPNLAIQKYLPMGSINESLATNHIINNESIIVSTIYVLIMLFIPYYLFLKRDIK